MRDDETEAQEQGKLAALYYKSLLAHGLSFNAALRLTCVWILAQHRTERPSWEDELGGDGP